MTRSVLQFVLLLVIVCGCKDNNPNGVYDPAFIVRGHVVDSKASTALSGVMVDFRDPTVSDSLVFLGDSLLPLSERTVPIRIQSQTDGSFEMSFYPGVRDTTRYKFLFAYKSGYQIWRFDRLPTSIIQLETRLDQMDVRLIPR